MKKTTSATEPLCVVRKRNFETSPCAFCAGRVKNSSDPACAVSVLLSHNRYPKGFILQIPRCRRCASLTKPIGGIALGGAVIGAVAGVLAYMNDGFFMLLLMSVLLFVAGFCAFGLVAVMAFNVVYRQPFRVYDVVRTIEDKYNYRTPNSKAKSAPSDAVRMDGLKEQAEKEFCEILKECDCEIVK